QPRTVISERRFHVLLKHLFGLKEVSVAINNHNQSSLPTIPVIFNRYCKYSPVGARHCRAPHRNALVVGPSLGLLRFLYTDTTTSCRGRPLCLPSLLSRPAGYRIGIESRWTGISLCTMADS